MTPGGVSIERVICATLLIVKVLIVPHHVFSSRTLLWCCVHVLCVSSDVCTCVVCEW